MKYSFVWPFVITLVTGTVSIAIGAANSIWGWWPLQASFAIDLFALLCDIVAAIMAYRHREQMRALFIGEEEKR